MALRKIALVCDWFYPKLGGIEVQLRGLARELKKRDYAVTVVTTEAGPSSVDGIPVIRLEVPQWQRWTYMASDYILKDVRRILLRGRFDLVHAHSVYSPLALASIRLAKHLEIPSVLTNHSLLVGAESFLFSTLNAGFGWGRDADVLTAVSGAVAESTRRVTGRDDVRVIPNGIHPAEWNMTHTTPPRPRVATVLRLTRRKRAIELVRAVPRVRERLPKGLHPLFTIIGDGPEREHIIREVERLGLTADVEILGSLPQEQVRQVLATTSVFVLPTVKEAFSIAALEARCAAIPVVAMNYGGVGDVIKDGVHGFLTPNLQEFAERIAELLRDRALHEQMARAVTQDLDRFHWNRVVETTLEAYGVAVVRHGGEASLGLDTQAVDVRP
jgi:glycosyltransferase involved in cell wall biosynthesis